MAHYSQITEHFPLIYNKRQILLFYEFAIDLPTQIIYGLPLIDLGP